MGLIEPKHRIPSPKKSKVTSQKDIFRRGSVAKDIGSFRSKGIDEFLV